MHSVPPVQKIVRTGGCPVVVARQLKPGVLGSIPRGYHPFKILSIFAT